MIHQQQLSAQYNAKEASSSASDAGILHKLDLEMPAQKLKVPNIHAPNLLLPNA